MGKRGQIWISAVLYILITTVVIAIILDAGIPLLGDAKDKTIFTKTKDDFVSLSETIKEVSSLGAGTQRTHFIEIQKGDLSIDDNKLKWEMQTPSTIIDSKSKVKLGDLTVASNVDVTSKEYIDRFVLENSYVKFEFAKLTDVVTDTSTLIQSVYYKQTNVNVSGSFSFDIDDPVAGISNSDQGIITTTLSQSGTDLDKSTVLARVLSTDVNYTLEFTLDSQSDFLTIKTTS